MRPFETRYEREREISGRIHRREDSKIEMRE